MALISCENSDSTESVQNSLQLTKVTDEKIEEDYTASRSMVVKNGIAYHVYSKEINPSSGNGSGLYLYIRDLETDRSEILELEHLSHLKIGMLSET